MFRYVTLNSGSSPNPQPINKKNQKTIPISLLSGGNSFFVKVKSNQIASNYNDTSNKIKPNPLQKINNTYFQKENKNKSYNKHLNNTQQKNSYMLGVNNSIEYSKKNPKKSLVNISKQDLFNHKKGIYTLTSMKHNDNMNNKTLNTTSLRQNYNGVLLTDVEQLKKNINKNFNIYEDKQENKNNIQEKNERNNNNILNYKLNKKALNSKNKPNNHNISETSLNKKIKTMKDKNTNLTTLNKSNNNQMKLYKKNQYIVKNNNKNYLKNRNLTNIVFNNNSNFDKSRHTNSNKNNCSEGKNKVIFNGPKKNKLICYKDINNNNVNYFKDHMIETDEFNNSISKRKDEKRIKSINIKPNNETLRIQKINNNSKTNFNTINNNKSLVVQKKFFDKNNNNQQHITNKSNKIINTNSKLINSFASREIFKLNYTLNELIGPNSNNFKSRMNKQIYYNDNKQKDKIGKQYLLSDITSYNIDRNKISNYPSIIINNNYLYNYMPLVTLNNSVDDENVKRLTLNKNSFLENKLENKKSNIINSRQNIQIDRGQTYILNYNSFVENNSKNLISNALNKENKSKINKKYKINQQAKINTSDNIAKMNNSINNKNNNIYNFTRKYVSSNTFDNINKTNRSDFSLLPTRTTSNNIVDCYVSKEKNKKQKQNPPLSKNPKKLNILSLIQENNRKIKDYNGRRQHQFHSFVETDNFNKCYNNKRVYETIDYVLYPENYKTKDSFDVLDNFDDMNTIIKRINFENVDLKSNNIFTVNDDKGSGKKTNNNFLYTKYSENFDKLFDKKYFNRNNNMSATQNKIKNNNTLYHSRQSGSTKDSNKQNSSTKKYRIFSYLGNKLDKK